MKKTALFWTRVLATAGIVLVWLPLLAPVVFGFGSLFSDGVFRFDFLMPAEIFPVILVGAGLLIWVAIWAKSYIKGTAWSFGLAVALLLISQGVAVVTGLASAKTDVRGWPFVLTMGIYFGFLLGTVALGVYGILLEIALFKKTAAQ